MSKITADLKPHQNKDYCILELATYSKGEKYYHACCIYLKYVVESYDVKSMLKVITEHYSHDLMSRFTGAALEVDYDDLTTKMKKMYEENKVLDSKK